MRQIFVQRSRLAIGVAAAALLWGCAERSEPAAGEFATASSAAARQCFSPRQVSGFEAADDRAVYVNVGTKRVFRLDLAGFCPDVDWSQRVAIRSRGGGSWICSGLDAEILVPSPTGVQSCVVTNVQPLGEAEIRAYRESRRSGER